MSVSGRYGKGFWVVRTVAGGLSLVAIAALLATYPNPEYRFGLLTASILFALFPSLLALVAAVWGGGLAERLIPKIWLIALAWTLFALIVFVLLGLNHNVLAVMWAPPLQIVALSLLVSTRDRERFALLSRIVRSGLAVLFSAWLVCSAVFWSFVHSEAAVAARGQPYCLAMPMPGVPLGSVVLPTHLDFMLFQRLISTPGRLDIVRNRVTMAVPGENEAHFHLSFGERRFVEGSDSATLPGCADALRFP